MIQFLFALGAVAISWVLTRSAHEVVFLLRTESWPGNGVPEVIVREPNNVYRDIS